MLHFLWILVQILIGYNLVVPIIIYLFYILLKKENTLSLIKDKENDYGIIVTAYEQTHTLPHVVNSLLSLHHSNYLIYIVADKCDVTNLDFKDDRVILLKPIETLGSNTKSHLYAIERFLRKHDCVTIIDSDNIAHPNYLTELDMLFNQGFMAVQGLRKAKNLNTTYACLDAARDIYYHFYDAKVLFSLGSSATLAGSGMAFKTELYLNFLTTEMVEGAGFDKVLQNYILRQNLRIAFTDKAIVFDEKTTRSDQLVKQRSRWLNTWFKYFYYGFDLLKKGIFNQSINQYLFGLILLRPPLFIFILLSVICFGINLFVSTLGATVWVVCFSAFIAAFLIALTHSETDKRIYSSLISIPKFIFFQILSLLKIRKANKISVATQHYHTMEDKE